MYTYFNFTVGTFAGAQSVTRQAAEAKGKTNGGVARRLYAETRGETESLSPECTLQRCTDAFSPAVLHHFSTSLLPASCTLAFHPRASKTQERTICPIRKYFHLYYRLRPNCCMPSSPDPFFTHSVHSLPERVAILHLNSNFSV